jgi:hypothetical protein
MNFFKVRGRISGIAGILFVALSQFALAGNFYSVTISGAFSGIAMIGAAAVILQTRVFNRRLGWVGVNKWCCSNQWNGSNCREHQTQMRHASK